MITRTDLNIRGRNARGARSRGEGKTENKKVGNPQIYNEIMEVVNSLKVPGREIELRDYLLSLPEESLGSVNEEGKTLAYNLAKEKLFPLSLASGSLLKLRNKDNDKETVLHALAGHPDLIARLPDEFLTVEYLSLRDFHDNGYSVADNWMTFSLWINRPENEQREGENFPIPKKLQREDIFLISCHGEGSHTVAHRAASGGFFPPGLWNRRILKAKISAYKTKYPYVFNSFFSYNPVRKVPEFYLANLLMEVKELGKDTIKDILAPAFELEFTLNKEDRNSMYQQVTEFLCETVETGDLKTIREVVDFLKSQYGKSLLSDADSIPRAKELKNLVLGNSLRAFNEVFDPELLQSEESSFQSEPSM